MTRSSIIVATVLTLIALPPLFSTMTTPASAQEQEWSDSDMSDGNMSDGNMSDGDLRDLLRDWVRDRPDRRDMLMEMLQDRRGRRAELMDRLHGRRDRRDRLRERLADRSGGNCYFLTRSLRDEDGSLLVVVRRRFCRD